MLDPFFARRFFWRLAGICLSIAVAAQAIIIRAAAIIIADLAGTSLFDRTAVVLIGIGFTLNSVTVRVHTFYIVWQTALPVIGTASRVCLYGCCLLAAIIGGCDCSGTAICWRVAYWLVGIY